MKHIVSLSGGVSSAVCADRVIQRFGRENVTLWFADTSWEDADLYRFMADCMARWGGELVIYKDGRNPLEVAEDVKLIPNDKIAPCTRILKIEPFVRFLETIEKPVTVYLGLDWREQDRMEAPKANYEAISGVSIEFPLMWEPWIGDNYFDLVEREWGIKTSEAYKEGFTHDNCGGRCIKAGQKHWLLLRKKRYDRFKEVRDWEQAQIAIGDARKNYSILRKQRNGVKGTLTLLELELTHPLAEEVEDTPVKGDSFACFCSF